MAPLTGPVTSGLQVLAIPGVVLLVAFLGYSSQWLFRSPTLQPGPLTQAQSITFNILLANLWWNYYKACTVSPGTYTYAGRDEKSSGRPYAAAMAAQRWCRKCDAPKPPRAHHCRHCRRCIPKMDHHCPWTGNCVSLQTFPYFYRFLVSTNVALWYLARLLYLRFRALFDERNLPAYLGPSPYQVAHLTVLSLVCAAVSFALGILLTTTTKSWLFNRTMIEDWEVERHEALAARRARGSTWWATDEGSSSSHDDEDGRDKEAVPRRVEFPYDVGIWENMCQAMGTRNVLAWLWPFSGGPTVSTTAATGVGWDWEENGFNARAGMWPPPDPDRRRRGRWAGSADAAVELPSYATPEEELAAFRARQERDQHLRRRRRMVMEQEQQLRQGSGIIAELEEDEELHDLFPAEEDARLDGDTYRRRQGADGEPGWTNADGERLRDFGVDEDAEDDVSDPGYRDGRGHGGDDDDDDDDDLPLAELLRRRKGRAAAVDT